MAEEKTKLERIAEAEEAERRTLELEELRESNQLRRQRREVRQMTHDANEQVLAGQRRAEFDLQRKCTHRKGGRDIAGARQQGHNGANYCKFEQKQPNGEVWVFCTRCHAVWKPGDRSEKHPTGISYRQARNWPTTNVMAEAVQFQFQKQVPGATSRREPETAEA